MIMRLRGGAYLRGGGLPGLVGRVGGIVDFPERHAVGRGDPGAVVVFGAEGRRPVLEPAELAPDRAERGLDLGALSLQLVPADRVAADAQRRGLAEKDLLHRGDPRLVA